MASWFRCSFMSDFEKTAYQCAKDINIALDNMLSVQFLGTISKNVPKKLVQAMRHGTLNGGKRMRPLLLRQAAEIFGIEAKHTIIAGAAIEMVHSYSLIHDDLPAMDDDDMRRGKKTVHKEFDEATAILAGDNLLTLAFEILASPNCHMDANLRLRLISELAKGAGASGMVGGQLRDLEGENKILSAKEIEIVQTMKTGALICSSVRMGAIIGLANENELFALTKFAQNAGRAFQLRDDILDEISTEIELGKATKKDAKSGKPTLIAQIGIEKAKQQLAQITEAALDALSPFGAKADALRASAKYFETRNI